MTWDPSGDWSVFDGQETLTYTPQNPVATAVSIAGCVREGLTFGVVATSGISVQPGDSVFYLPRPNCGAVTPKLGDQFTDSDAITWTVQASDYYSITQFWRLVARQAR